MGVIAEGILRGCQGLFAPVSLGYPLSVFNKNSKRSHGKQWDLGAHMLEVAVRGCLSVQE